jgi:hypothetical protein
MSLQMHMQQIQQALLYKQLQAVVSCCAQHTVQQAGNSPSVHRPPQM